MATATATATAIASAAPSPTPTATAVTNCGKPLPNGPSLFYSASSGATGLQVYAGDFNGTSTSSGTGIGGGTAYLGSSFAIALGPNANVYALEYPPGAGVPATASVAEFLPNFGCTGPIATLDGLPFVFPAFGGVAVDAAGYVYVASTTGRLLSLYAPLVAGSQSPRPLATVTIPSAFAGNASVQAMDPIAIALDVSGRIYIANGLDDDILVYPARSGTTLSSTPTATIAGSMTGLYYADGIAVDASGTIYVSDESYDLRLFAANPSGTINEAPIATITGSQTQITGSPYSIAVDHLGEIYLGTATSANYSEILEFPPNPTGTVNEAPQGSLIVQGNPNGLVGK